MLTRGRWRIAHRAGSLLDALMRPSVRRLVRNNGGQDLIEYALLTGMIAIAGVLVFPTIQTKMATAYRAWNDGAQVIWEVPPPL